MRVLLLTLITSLLLPDLIAQEGRSMTLDECIAYALENNESGKITSLEKAIAEAEVRKTIGTGLPQVEITSGLNYNYEIQQSIVDFSNFDPTVPPGTEGAIAFSQAYDGNMNLSLRQLIFDGSFFVGLQASRTYQELSQKDHIKTEIDIVEAVSKAYYSVLINDERVELLERNYRRMDSLLQDTRIMNENGFAEKIDVDRLQVNSNNLKVELDRLTQYSDISYKMLKFQMGMDLNEELALSQSLDELSPEKMLAPQDFNHSNRIEFSQLETNEELIKLDMKNNRVQYLPKLYANFNYGANSAAPDFSTLVQSDRWFSFGAVGLSLTIPVFDGFIKKNRIQQNKIQLEQIDAQMSLLSKSIDLEIQQSAVDLNSNLDALDVQEQNMELAQDIYNKTQTKYKEGVGSNLEVIDADTSLKEAQTNYYNALFDAVIAQIELKKALGTLHQ